MSTIVIGLCFFLVVALAIVFIKSRNVYKEIDKKYGKPYAAKVIKMIGGHPELKQGTMALSFHPMDAIAFNRKVFHLSQIDSIKIISEVPKLPNIKRETDEKYALDEKFLCIVTKDGIDEHKIIFTASSDFEVIANTLMQKWKRYNLKG
ncbi:hypothetical protein [Desulfosporosinus sp. FKA]|uniref:hypothetical protein n=1 Tax=Desulfosporosinus sp. FKA TaxID=1969834 RepID=UPI001124F02F|nr:hypothetical protein [Desulfosporosinus sp. FKA]